MRGRTAGAVYVSFTVEAGAEEGAFPSGTVGVLNDTDFDVDADGAFEIIVGGPPQDRGLAAAGPDASRITVRHYWEQADPPATPPAPTSACRSTWSTATCPPAPPAPTDATVAASIRRMATYVRSRTLDDDGQAGARATLRRSCRATRTSSRRR